MGQDSKLEPFDKVATQRYNLWLGRMKQRGVAFTAQQLDWLGEIKNFIVYNSSITERDIQETLSDKGGLLKARQVFAELNLKNLLNSLNATLMNSEGK